MLSISSGGALQASLSSMVGMLVSTTADTVIPCCGIVKLRPLEKAISSDAFNPRLDTDANAARFDELVLLYAAEFRCSICCAVLRIDAGNDRGLRVRCWLFDNSDTVLPLTEDPLVHGVGERLDTFVRRASAKEYHCADCETSLQYCPYSSQRVLSLNDHKGK